MRIIRVIEEQKSSYNLGKESNSDLITLEVQYTSGETGKLYVDRATYNRMKFQEELEGKVVSYEDLEKFRDLCTIEEQEERSWDED